MTILKSHCEIYWQNLFRLKIYNIIKSIFRWNASISAVNIEWLAIYLNWKVMLEFVEKQVEDIAKQMKDIA